MLYTLIIIAALYPSYQSGAGVSVHSVPGFSTEQACINVHPALKAICVPMGV